MDTGFFNSDIFAWVILPILIFLSRICDVSIGTIRLIFVSKGFKIIAPLLGFFEVIIWLVAVSQIMKHLDNIVCYIAYGGGFAMGNYVGMYLEEKLSIGNVIIRIISKVEDSQLIKHLKENNFGLTILDAEGAQQKVKIIFSVIKREDVNRIVSVINEINPHAFYTIEEVKTVNEGVFRPGQKKLLNAFSFINKKGK
ncbi:MAG TPA: DUF2179 domain-containing protein [Bacteroidales bacterium]|nr:DUF2179 domain-containing protein [Bacteroidales bacterium]HPS18316.1 DUF2179 domain-containing protein [Bacteroidales bacterium]